MLAFITSLRHPQNSYDYGEVESLLRSTLDSIAAQTDDDYVVIVVGNQRPSFELPERVEYVQVDFEAPAPPGPPTDRADVRRDKGRKLAIGLIAARAHRPDYAMIFDADDFLHRDIVAFTRQHPGAPGWVIDEGWIYSRTRNAYRALDRFNWLCGTCFIVNYEAYGVPADLGTDATEEQLRAGFGERLERIIATHHGEHWFRENGYDLASFPWRSVVYHVDTGENRSGKSLTGIARPLGEEMRRDFTIPASHGPLRTLWESYGPLAVFQTARGRLRRLAKRLRGAEAG